MPITHFLLAILVVVIWGINFIFVKLALGEISPLLLCAVRFLLASIPAIFFIKPPAISFKIVTLYGLVMFALQFSLLFMGVKLGMSAGMGCLLLQAQVFFSVFFAVIFLGETLYFYQIVGAGVSFTGMGLVATHFDKNMSLLGFILILAAAAAWGMGNLISKKAKNVNIIALVVWGSFVASIPMLLLSLLCEKTSQLVYTYHHLTLLGAGSVLYIVYISTCIAYSIWGWLIHRYSIGIVAPFTLLAPVVGLLGSVLVLGEPCQSWKLIAGLLVITGLSINVLGSRFLIKKANVETGSLKNLTL